MTKEEFRRLLMKQARQVGAVSDSIVDACIMFQFELCMDADAILDMQSTRFDLLVEAHSKQIKEIEERNSETVKKRFGYD
jgi:hypothetical protein